MALKGTWPLSRKSTLDGFDFYWMIATVAAVCKGKRNSELKSMSCTDERTV